MADILPCQFNYLCTMRSKLGPTEYLESWLVEQPSMERVRHELSR